MSPEEKRILDMLYIAPYDWKGLKAWFVRFKWYPDGVKSAWHGKLFNWSRYPTPNDALDAARAYRNSWLAENKDKLWLRGGGGFNAKLPRNNTSGILGVNRATRILPSGNPSEEWQTTYLRPDGSDENRKFSARKFGELGAMKLAIEARRKGLLELKKTERFSEDATIDDMVDYYDDILSNIADLNDRTPGPSVLEIVRDPNITGTSKFQQIQIRVGQQRFRRSVLQLFDNRCAITGSSILIRASHIKPWRIATDEERVDPLNGLALSPTFDAAFDLGLISFRNDGVILIATQLKPDAEKLGIRGDEQLLFVTDGHARYLDWHRKNIFEANELQAPALSSMTDDSSAPTAAKDSNPICQSPSADASLHP